MAIAVFGSVNIDLVCYSDHLPRPGETLHGQRYAIGLGGKGCNQAVAVARLGHPVTLVGRVGKDGFGDTALASLAEHGVPADGILVDEQSDTGVAVIGVDAAAQNCITVIGGANMAVSQADVERARAVFESAEVLLLQLEIPMEAALAAADLVRSHGGRVIFDPAPAPAGGLDGSVLSRIDVITPNETETEILTGIRPTDAQSADKAANALMEQGAQAAVVKLGKDGVFYRSTTEKGFVAPFKVTPVDSVAAGDCFNGGLAFALAEGKSMGEAVRFAAACGALSTTKTGASGSAPGLADVQSLMSVAS